MANKKKNPVPNKELYNEIVKSKQQDELTEEAQRMLYLLAERAICKLRYVNEEDKEDCLQNALMDLMKYWRNFDENRYSNAFAYYTELAKKGFAKGWDTLYPQRYKGTISINSIKSQDNEEEGEMFNI